MAQRKYQPGSSPLSTVSSSRSNSEDSLLPIDNSDKERSSFARPLASRHRCLYVACASLAATSVLALAFFTLRTIWSGQYTAEELSQVEQPLVGNANESLSPAVELLGPETWLIGHPTERFRDNLRPDVKYISSWVSAGWTNDVMTYANLIYLGLITDRVPIIPMFTPSHIGGQHPPINFGDVFDVPRLRKALGKPILEWHEVKDHNSEVLDEVGCWNTWEAVQDREHYPRHSSVPDHLKLDISYTTAPTWIKVLPNFQHDQHSYFWSLAALAFPETRAASLVPPLQSKTHGVRLPPDEQMLCYDYLYYVCANQPFEFEFDYSPAWREVAQHMHFTTEIEHLANQYVRQAIGSKDGELTPPYIAIHVRHLDFGAWCGDTPIDECFATLPVIARRVREVQDELLERKGIVVKHVIMTSDERNATWWDGVVAQGWFGLDHSKTAELYGPWYPVLIDAAIQSGGIGYVGTDRSTMSMMGRRRVETWHKGVVRTVRWGKPDSDDH